MPSRVPLVERVLPEHELQLLRDYEDRGGARARLDARQATSSELIDLVGASGLRGRGGAGFPTGEKWRTVGSYESSVVPTTVVVNGAEGEPGTFKDRSIIRRNPYAVIEGAVIAARAVDADRVVIAVKESFLTERRRLADAIEECRAAGWFAEVNIGVVAGPGEYLFGEETGLLEVLDGRPPFPRVAPPYRHGIDEFGREPGEPAGTIMSSENDVRGGPPPTLVNNVETMANIPGVVAGGPDRFRAVGTDASPGTLVCTITGATAQHGVAEVPMGTTLAEAIDLIGDGPTSRRRRLVAAVSGVANSLLTADRFDTPLTYEDMRAVGSGLGAGGFIVFDDTTDFAAVAAGVARFLAVESCGQCAPCKQDGWAIAEGLARICRNDTSALELVDVADLLQTVIIGARCSLATQHQQLVQSIIRCFPDHFTRHFDERSAPVDPALIAPIVELEGTAALLDAGHARKQPDWTYDETDSGKAPVERLAIG